MRAVATAQRRKTVTLSTTELSVLGLLSAFGEHSGYDLKKHAAAGVGYVWTAAKSHIYAVLPRLVEGGYATSRRVEQSPRPDKQVYRITAKGEEAFQVWLEEPVRTNFVAAPARTANAFEVPDCPVCAVAVSVPVAAFPV